MGLAEIGRDFQPRYIKTLQWGKQRKKCYFVSVWRWDQTEKIDHFPPYSGNRASSCRPKERESGPRSGYSTEGVSKDKPGTNHRNRLTRSRPHSTCGSYGFAKIPATLLFFFFLITTFSSYPLHLIHCKGKDLVSPMESTDEILL